jgi:enterochelin esterase-like enzyme
MHGRRLLGLAVVVALFSLAGWGLFRLYLVFKPDQHDASVTRFTIESTLAGRSLEEIVVVPKGGGAGRPLLVLLHGRSSSPDSYLTKYWFDALARLGSRAPVLLLVNGGDSSYYHDRADGRWGSYVMQERTGAETPAGAFDSAEDFERNDVIELSSARNRPLGKMRVWIDVGNRDPFVSADTELARSLRRRGQKITFHVWSGSHSRSYWDAHVAAYLRFYADALAAC